MEQLRVSADKNFHVQDELRDICLIVFHTNQVETEVDMSQFSVILNEARNVD